MLFFAEECLWPNCVIKTDFETELLLSQGFSFKAYKMYSISPPYSRIYLQNCTKAKICDVRLKLRLMLQSRAKYTVLVACQLDQRGILRWSWNEVYITIRWDAASWCARNSCEKCYSLFCFRLLITSAYIQVCISLSPTFTRSLNIEVSHGMNFPAFTLYTQCLINHGQWVNHTALIRFA